MFTRHCETDLPYVVGPFRMESNGKEWIVEFESTNGKISALAGCYTDPFDACLAMIKAHREWLPTRPRPMVYFIGPSLAVGELVKIGTSSNPEARRRSLQTAHGRKLTIFAMVEGDRELEARYHSRWRARRRTGEWFLLGDPIIREIERLRAGQVSATIETDDDL